MDVLRDNISKYCNYDDIDNKNSDDVAAKAKVIRKYKWLVVYHNQLRYMHKKEDCILTINYTFDSVTLNECMN